MAQQRLWPAMGLVGLTTLFIGCISIRVSENVTDPSCHFQKAYSEIEKIQRDHPHREGRPRRLNLLVYDAAERNMIKLGVPIWMVNACLEAGLGASEDNKKEFDFELRSRVDWRSIKNLCRVGPGLLVEVVDEKAKMLIWLN